MIKVEHIDVYGFEGAVRGMRNPLNSWHLSDSYWTHIEDTDTLETANYQYFVGEKDLDLMKRLYKAGNEHRKYARQIYVSMDITAPFYWWKEFDTYRIGVTENSCSTMHKIHEKEFTFDDFSCEHLDDGSMLRLKDTIYCLNANRTKFNEAQTKPMKEEAKRSEVMKHHWWQMIQLLPMCYNQKRTVTMNYENVFAMIKQRSGHKLDEWREFVEILKDLPYVKEIMGDEQ